MKKLALLVPLFSLLFLSACSRRAPTDDCSTGTGDSCKSGSGTLDHSNLSGAIDDVLLALKNNDMQTLSTFVGTQGLRFSPYEHVNIPTDIVLTTEVVANALSISAAYTWGAYDGSGEPINLGIGQYFERFVTDADWATAPEVNYNQITQRGNIINNIVQVYPGKQTAEFYFSGFDPQYGGMDRKSLTLIFQQENGQWNLIGIVHGSWTI